MEKLIKVLKSSPISDYKISVKHVESVELFYVLNKLETNRATNIDEVAVTIYVDEGEFRGQSTFSYYPYMSEEEIKELIKKKIFAAKFALNPHYELPGKNDEKPRKIPTNFENYSLLEAGERIAKAVLAAKKYQEGNFSANEIFVYKTDERILNSKGVDLSMTSYRAFIELIPSWEEGEKEVETYNNLEFSNLDEEEITRQVNEAMEITRDRFNAVDLKIDKPVKVIIEGEDVPDIFEFFIDSLSYRYKYMHMNRFNVGDHVQGDEVTGDKINLSMLPFYVGASKSRSFDGDGVVLKEVNLIKDGVAQSMFGSHVFGCYLNEKNPTGVLPIVKVEPGQKSFKEMKKEPYLRCVKFSSFQFDEYSGFFGGEVRLGYYFDGEKEIPVTSFSIQGDINQAKTNMIFSKEEQVLPDYVGPKYIEIKGIGIN